MLNVEIDFVSDFRALCCFYGLSAEECSNSDGSQTEENTTEIHDECANEREMVTRTWQLGSIYLTSHVNISHIRLAWRAISKREHTRKIGEASFRHSLQDSTDYSNYG